MANVNTVAVSGNLCADPELKELPSGTKVAELRMAHNRSRKTDDGYVEETSFFSIKAWSGFAELIGKKLRKGDAITVTGRLQEESWEKDGQKRSKTVIVADQIDSQSFFKKAEDVAPLESGSTDEPAATPAASDDDIPF